MATSQLHECQLNRPLSFLVFNKAKNSNTLFHQSLSPTPTTHSPTPSYSKLRKIIPFLTMNSMEVAAASQSESDITETSGEV